VDPASSTELAKQVLLMCGIVLATGAVAALLAAKLRTPDIAVFLLAGMAFGPGGFGLLHVRADSALNQIILIFGSCYLLFDGGASVRLGVLRQVWVTLALLATAGVLISAAVVAVAAHWLLGLQWIAAVLLGAAIASTDPATLVPIFRQIAVRERVAQTVMSESAFNDATGAILTFAVLGVALGTGEFSLAHALGEFLRQAGFGLAIGVALGYLAALAIAHKRYAFLVEYAPIVTLMAVIGAFLSADGIDASGFTAVFVFGIMLGNKDRFGFSMGVEEARRLDEFVGMTTFMMRMFIFILLGSQIDFAAIGRHLAGGAALVAVLMLVARPLTVFACALPDRRARWTMQELLFMCWTRETGVIPAALAGLLLGLKAPGAQAIAAVTFIAILTTILIQATTTRWLARRLGLLIEEN
jgi:cell volume regulation protein A